MVPVLALMFAAQGFPERAPDASGARHLDGDHRVHLDLQPARAPPARRGDLAHRARASRRASSSAPCSARKSPDSIPTRPLAIFFAVFIAYVAVQMILNVKPKPSRQLPGTAGMFGVGAFIGGISALVAIGGGSLSVPFMTWCNVKVHHAIGTSAAIGFPIALAGTIGYMISGYGATEPARGRVRLHLPAGVGGDGGRIDAGGAHRRQGGAQPAGADGEEDLRGLADRCCWPRCCTGCSPDGIARPAWLEACSTGGC